MSDLSYPIGKFHYAGSLTENEKQQCMDDIAAVPANLRAEQSFDLGLGDSTIEFTERYLQYCLG